MVRHKTINKIFSELKKKKIKCPTFPVCFDSPFHSHRQHHRRRLLMFKKATIEIIFSFSPSPTLIL
jgi:hypothetical protein